MRYAILFSGMSFRRHVNDLEFCYRMLIDHFRFAAANVHVLNYDGSLRAAGECETQPVGPWPGDGTPYRMIVNAEGSRSAFRYALNTVGRQLHDGDQLFINTTGHGGHHGIGWAPDLLAYPFCNRYNCRDFCADIAQLPPHRSLVVLMSQCFSGGFKESIVDASPAACTVFISSTSETQQSFASFADPTWNSFQRNYIAALGRRDVDGTAPTALRGTQTPRSHVTFREAFTYAINCPERGLYDSPEYATYPEIAADGSLHEDIPTPTCA